MNIRIRNHLVLLVFLWSWPLFWSQAQAASSSETALATKAQELYDSGSFEESKKLYRGILGNHGVSIELLYNLGCAAFRAGDLGLATAAWESARLMSPRDEDILWNLKIVKKSHVDELPEVPSSFLQSWWKGFWSYFSLNEWTEFLFFCCGLLLLWLFFRGRLPSSELRIVSGLLVGALVLLCLGGFGSAYAGFFAARGVILDQEIAIFSGPERAGKKVATVHAGLMVEMTGKAGKDLRIKLPTGWEGYLPESSVQSIELSSWQFPEAPGSANQ